MEPPEVSRRRNGLLSSCEPCRKSKQACDHAAPTCGRCTKRGTPDKCIYHPAPLTGLGMTRDQQRVRKRPKIKSPSTTLSDCSYCEPEEPILKRNYRKTIYADPGYLGSSSSSAVFEEIQGHLTAVPQTDGSGFTKEEAARAELLHKNDGTKIKAGVEILAMFCENDNMALYSTLVAHWYEHSLGGSLISPLIKPNFAAVKAMAEELCGCANVPSSQLKMSERLFENTFMDVKLRGTMTLEDFIAQFTGDHLRWETIGLVFTSIGMSAINLHPSDPMFTSREQRQRICKEAVDASDTCIACCDSIEQLNDYRIFLLFESFILHSLQDGDSSYYTWSRSGDISSAIFAHGLHQEIKPGPELPFFLAELRKRTLALAYSQDKELATFLGRPCRISRKFCVLQLPLDVDESCFSLPEDELKTYLEGLDEYGWNKEGKMRHSCWSRTLTLCAIVRESILELVLGSDNSNLKARIDAARKQAEDFWNGLPEFARRTAPMSDDDADAFLNNCNVFYYLSHLYNIFLIERISVRKLKTDSSPLLNICRDIMILTLEAIHRREQLKLINGDLAWLVSAYGLPTAGVLALELLQQTRHPSAVSQFSISRSETIQNLSVLVSQMTFLIPPGEGNYVLFSKARKMLQAILDVVLAPPRIQPAIGDAPSGGDLDVRVPIDGNPVDGEVLGSDWSWFDQLDFNGDFWTTVADHPLLAPTELTT